MTERDPSKESGDRYDGDAGVLKFCTRATATLTALAIELAKQKANFGEADGGKRSVIAAGWSGSEASNMDKIEALNWIHVSLFNKRIKNVRQMQSHTNSLAKKCQGNLYF